MKLHRQRLIPAVAVALAALGLAAVVAFGQNARHPRRGPAQASSGPTTWNLSNLPRWAYVNGFGNFGTGFVAAMKSGRSPARRPAPANQPIEHVPGSNVGLTRSQIFGMAGGPPDWFPNDHPPMPKVVAHGINSGLSACAFCHLPNGQGRPENASLAGLPEEYILRQLADFKDGSRKSAAPRSGSYFMEPIASAITQKEAEAAAKYFSSIHYKPWIRVIETNTVPVTHPAGQMLSPVKGGGTEPIGNRIIEVPVNPELTEMRDDHSGFIAYVPKGSVERGARLVMTGGNGTTIRCTICHGPNLMGIGNVPFIAGRSPDQMVRQLIDIQAGTRRSPYALLMRQPVQNLSLKDIVDIAAYLASLPPKYPSGKQ